MEASNDLTKGKPLKVIIIFALPIFIGNLFQQFYNIMDSVIVGHILGDSAFAAVGATSPVVSMVLGMAFGMTNGFSIVIARYFGAKDYYNLRKAYAGALVLTVICSAVMTIVSMIAGFSLLKFLKTPKNIIYQSWEYLIIIFIGIVVMMGYNVLSGALRGIGNSKMPLVFLIISSLLNIMLDLFFIKILSFGVRGVAVATVLAQGVSVVLCFFYMHKKCFVLKLTKSDFCLDKSILWEMFTTGISMGLMLSIVSIGTVTLQSAINGFGMETVAAHSAARKIGEMLMVPLSTVCMAVSTYVSQNDGAGRKDRIMKGIWCGILLTFIWSAVSNLLVFTVGKPLLFMITGTKNQEIIVTALKYMHINLPFYFLLSLLLIFRWVLQGLGHKMVPLLASSVELFGKCIVAKALVPVLGYFGVCICEPLIWGVCAIMVGIDFGIWLKKNHLSEMKKLCKD